MIKNIIFDFGDIFINLDKKATANGLQKLGLISWDDELEKANLQFEKGQISPENFLQLFEKKMPKATQTEILEAWNAVLLDFPNYRLYFLKELSKNYQLFLLSNTDSIHIKTFENRNSSFTNEFYNCLKKVYYSFEMGQRKPDAEIFETVIKEQNLKVSETLFVDDRKDNCETAKQLGMHVWHLQVGQEDVVDLLSKNLPW